MHNIDNTLLTICDKWQQWLTFSRGCSENTVKNYVLDLQAFLTSASVIKSKIVTTQDIADFTLADFRMWLSLRKENGYSNSSTARAIGAVRNFFKFLTRFDIHNKAIHYLKVPKKPKNLPKPIDYNDILLLISFLRENASKEWGGLRNEAWISLIYGYGLRIGEALSIKVSDIPLEQNGTSTVQIVGRAGKKRNIYVFENVSLPFRKR